MSSTPVGQPLVSLRKVSKSYGAMVAVHPLDLEIRKGDFLAILGPSGCGKTTLLNMISGFSTPTTGAIVIGGVDVTRLGPEQRSTNIVVQGYGLFPHMTVGQNIGYGLRIRRTPPDEIAARVREIVELVQLEGFDKRPVTQLSGGQQQRVALARALVMRPEVLLLDEPLAALDLQLRRAMQEELRRIHRSIGGTFLFVTHDQEEAMQLANRIAIMKGGRLMQEGTAEEIYERPSNHFVSTFIGDANAFNGVRQHGVVTLDVGLKFASEGPNGPVVCVVRPDATYLAHEPGAEAFPMRLGGVVIDIVFLGAYRNYKVRVGEQIVSVPISNENIQGTFSVGDTVVVHWRPEKQIVLASE